MGNDLKITAPAPFRSSTSRSTQGKESTFLGQTHNLFWSRYQCQKASRHRWLMCAKEQKGRVSYHRYYNYLLHFSRDMPFKTCIKIVAIQNDPYNGCWLMLWWFYPALPCATNKIVYLFCFVTHVSLKGPWFVRQWPKCLYCKSLFLSPHATFSTKMNWILKPSRSCFFLHKNSRFTYGLSSWISAESYLSFLT